MEKPTHTPSMNYVRNFWKMIKYKIELSKSSKKFLDKSDRVTKDRVINVIHSLTENPY